MSACENLSPVPPMPQDALSAPTGDALLPAILAYLPRGSAWRTDYVADVDDSSMLHRFWRAVADPVSDLYAKSWELVLQSTACTVTSGIDDWEAEFGLPDPCVAPAADFADRVANLREKVAGEGGGSIPYFICVAARLGYAVTIEEPHFFEFGVSSFDGATTDPFGPDMQAYWIVHIGQSQPRYFEFGASSFGYDRFSDFDEALDLECVFNARKPAHTTLVFDYSGAIGAGLDPGTLSLAQPSSFLPLFG